MAAKRIAVVTGGAKWLGREYALQLAAAGDHVIVADIDDEGASLVVEEIAAAGGTGSAVHVDVTDEASVTEAFHRIGDVAVLVNNAGGVVASPRPAEQLSLSDWNRMLAVNLTGAWLCSRAVIPSMKAARRGRIINIGSTCFAEGLPTGMAAYVAAKGGVTGLTRALARELGEYGVTVNTVSPGLFYKAPEQVDDNSPLRPGRREQIRDFVVDRQSLPRDGALHEVASAVVYLASDAAGFITGQTLNVDGGWDLT